MEERIVPTIRMVDYIFEELADGGLIPLLALYPLLVFMPDQAVFYYFNALLKRLLGK
jgi:hypothetical protein